MKKIIFGIVAVVGLSFGTMAQTESTELVNATLVEYDQVSGKGAVVTNDGEILQFNKEITSTLMVFRNDH